MFFPALSKVVYLLEVKNHGGYYFDTTFEILQPLYNLLNKKGFQFVGCNEYPRFKNADILSNSFFGATKRNPILKRLLLKSSLNKINFYDMAVDFQTGPGYLRSGIQLTDSYYIFPTSYFYPFVESLYAVVTYEKINKILDYGLTE